MAKKHLSETQHKHKHKDEYEYESFSSDSEIEYEPIDVISSWRPNAHGGHHSLSSTFQPLSNRYQKFSHHIRASPLEEWEEGSMNIAMSNTVTTAIRATVRDMAIGKTRTSEKADRATVEQVNINYFIKFYNSRRKKGKEKYKTYKTNKKN